jgi:translation initiation factor IF-2
MLIIDFVKKFNVPMQTVFSALKDKGINKATPQYRLTEPLIAFLKSKLRVVEEERKVAQFIAKKGAVLFNKDLSVGEIAAALGCQSSELIVVLLRLGVLANINQIVKKNIIERVAGVYNVPFLDEVKKQGLNVNEIIEAKVLGGTEKREPVIAVVGHVDHGKTTLLDYIRKASVADGEAGGITQRLGAYKVKIGAKSMVFLDTPGHEAFSLMRERGVLIADIVILVVALDDGLKPQTIECIKKAKEYGVPMIVAMNKKDKAAPERVDVIKRQLSEQDVLADDWGGDVSCVSISAKLGQGIDELLDVVQLRSEMMDLSAKKDGAGLGYVLDTEFRKGLGPIATLLLYSGVAKKGDYFVCGNVFGRINTLSTSANKELEEVGVSEPVLASGFKSLPCSGDKFEILSLKESKKRQKEALAEPYTIIDNSEEAQAVGVIKVVVKAQSFSSLEALIKMINQMNEKNDIKIIVVKAAVGELLKGDVELAYDADAILCGFAVKEINRSTLDLQSRLVKIVVESIIYKLIDYLQDLVDKKDSLREYRTDLAEGYVKAIFNIKSIGIIAGVHIEKGKVEAGCRVEIMRGGEMVGSGKIKSLQVDRKSVAVVESGKDCAFQVVGFTAWKDKDKVIFLDMKTKKQLENR